MAASSLRSIADGVAPWRKIRDLDSSAFSIA
jgi:hypothetical protein